MFRFVSTLRIPKVILKSFFVPCKWKSLEEKLFEICPHRKAKKLNPDFVLLGSRGKVHQTSFFLPSNDKVYKQTIYHITNTRFR